jgi:HEAT repeat protein
MTTPETQARPALDEIGNPQARLQEVLWRVEHWGAAELRPLLLDCMRDPFLPIRSAAAKALAKRMEPGLADQLRALALDAAGALEVRRAATVALRGAPGEETLAALVALASDQDADLRYQALTSLFALEVAPAALEPLVIAGLADPDQEISGVSAQIAAARGITAAVPAMLAAHARLRWANRLHVTLALCELASQLDEDTRAALPHAALVQDLGKALRDTTCAGAAAHALMAFDPALAYPKLTRTLTRWLIHPLIKVEIAGVLAGAGHEEGGAYLLGALASRRRDVRGWAIEQAGQHRVRACAPALELMASGDGAHALPALQAIARLPDADARLTALEATIKDPQLAARARRLRHKLAREQR